MPNFPPLRRHVFSIVDRWIARHSLKSPFLEIGCGTGDLAAHLAGRGWEGVALDSSPEAVDRARRTLEGFPKVRTLCGGLDGVPTGPFNTVFIMDVLEHVTDDAGLLAALAERTAPGGVIVLLVPVNPREWRRDDDLYGHIRRYGWDELEGRVAAAGFDTVERWNVTWPFMWAMRRLYLLLLPRSPVRVTRDTLTASSSFYNPWSENRALGWAGYLLGLPVWWRPFLLIQDVFRKSRRGHAVMLLARRSRS
jgi:SAM-dependent methyltransferase